MEPKLMHPSSRAFQRDQECDRKHPASVDLISINKTNKQPSFIDRLIMHICMKPKYAIACNSISIGNHPYKNNYLFPNGLLLRSSHFQAEPLILITLAPPIFKHIHFYFINIPYMFGWEKTKSMYFTKKAIKFAITISWLLSKFQAQSEFENSYNLSEGKLMMLS